MNNNLENVCVIGLGYVGLTLAVAMANAGYKVHGVERSEHIRNCVNNGRAHFSEQGLDAPLKKHVEDNNIICSEKVPPRGVASAYIITVGTPLNKGGIVDLSALEAVLKMVASVIDDGDTIILRSTVKIGTSRSIAKRILDEAGKSYHLAFCPERTLEGKALDELTSLPQVVGGVDAVSADKAAGIFSRLAPKIIHVSSLEAAEMVKLVNNTQRDLMFGFANEIAEMCDAANIAAMEVIRAACEDYPRSKIALPGPVGGPCLEKDPHILAEGLRDYDYLPRISLAGRRLNEELPEVSIARIARWFEKSGVFDLGADTKITILGLAFKGQPETNDLRGTMAAHILTAARRRWPRAKYQAFDPVVRPTEFDKFDLDVCKTLEEAFDETSLVLIQNNHKVFCEMNLEMLLARMKGPALVYDYWNLFAGKNITFGSVRYGGLGNMVEAGTEMM